MNERKITGIAISYGLFTAGLIIRAALSARGSIPAQLQTPAVSILAPLAAAAVIPIGRTFWLGFACVPTINYITDLMARRQASA